ncbi:hypothetical protein [Laspinema olomoucense]|uniref:hypothetical protein n=1 Tax=Laspinema olomoucense TaxID=3231600 RepID=UPI0021BB71CD|nr:hypothetical protein [Laspinema sp. D3d]MCT7971092.1 hypothetical protein [Laspinema sp. D3d]
MAAKLSRQLNGLSWGLECQDSRLAGEIRSATLPNLNLSQNRQIPEEGEGVEVAAHHLPLFLSLAVLIAYIFADLWGIM